MQEYEIQIIKSVIAFAVLIITLKISQNIIDKAGRRFFYNKVRIKLVKKIISVLFYFALIAVTILIWGIEPSQLAAYLASVFTVVGIAFLAQWSIISNITSTLIIFFNHQVNIGDTIEILDNDFHIQGTISDIGIFFIVIKLSSDEYVSLPSNIFMQKMVKKVKEEAITAS